MVNCLYTEDGLVYSYIEWNVVDELGKLKENGEYIYVADLWIHPDIRFRNVINELIPLIDLDPRSHKAHSVYWTNLKHSERKTPTYPKERLLKKGLKHGK